MDKSDVAKEALELNKKIVDVMLCHSLESSHIFVKAYETEIKYKTERLANLLDEEPLLFFKKKHALWEQKVKELEQEIDDANKKLYEEYCEIGETISLLQN